MRPTGVVPSESVLLSALILVPSARAMAYPPSGPVALPPLNLAV